MNWNDLHLYRRNIFEARGGEIETEYDDIWTLQINFDRDVLAGMLAIGCELINIINDTEEDTYLFELSNRYDTIEVTSLSDLDNNYVGIIDTRKTDDIYPPDGLFGLWIRNYEQGSLNFYVFEHPAEFMQGLISIANAFQVDFHDYIQGLPFDSERTEYNIIQ